MIVNPKALQAKAREHKVVQQDAVGNVFKVTSGSSGKEYTVHVQREVKDGAIVYAGARCSCPWGQYRPSAQSFRSGCSHVIKVYNRLMSVEQGRSVSAWASKKDADRQKRQRISAGDGLWLTTRKGPKSHKAQMEAGARRKGTDCWAKEGPRLFEGRVYVPSPYYKPEAARFWGSKGFTFARAEYGAEHEWERGADKPIDGKKFSPEKWLEAARRKYFEFYPEHQV